jgi:hypothetical protein
VSVYLSNDYSWFPCGRAERMIIEEAEKVQKLFSKGIFRIRNYLFLGEAL